MTILIKIKNTEPRGGKAAEIRTLSKDSEGSEDLFEGVTVIQGGEATLVALHSGLALRVDEAGSFEEVDEPIDVPLNAPAPGGSTLPPSGSVVAQHFGNHALADQLISQLGGDNTERLD